MIKKNILFRYEHRAQQNARNDFEKYFFKLMNNAVFGKTMDNMRKHRDIEIVINKSRKNYLLSETNYRATNLFFRKCISHRNKINTNIHE